MPAYMMRCHHPQHVASRAAAALLLRTTTPPALLLLLLLLAHTSGPAAGYPNLWRQCGGQHPDGGAGRHGAAKPDPSMTFVLQGLGAPQAGYCPGGKYTVGERVGRAAVQQRSSTAVPVPAVHTSSRA